MTEFKSNPWELLECDDDRAFRSLDIRRLSIESKRFYRSALRQNRLGFLLAMRKASGFEVLDQHHLNTNKLIDAVVEVSLHTTKELRPQEGLFALVQSLESVSFFMHLMHISRLCLNEKYRPQSLSPKHYILDNNTGRLSFRKRLVVLDIANGIRASGCTYLAEMFYLHYVVVGHVIRNALSHSTFVSPDVDGDGGWRFDECYIKKDDMLDFRSLKMDHDELKSFIKNVLQLRVCFFDAVKYIAGKMDARYPISLSLDHPMIDGEVVKCEMDSKSLTLSNFKQPRWPEYI